MKERDFEKINNDLLYLFGNSIAFPDMKMTVKGKDDNYYVLQRKITPSGKDVFSCVSYRFGKPGKDAFENELLQYSNDAVSDYLKHVDELLKEN